MKQRPLFRIVPATVGCSWPRGFCSHRGDLGCLAEHAQAAGYRAQGLVESLGVMPRELRRVFKETLGIAVKNWLVQVRTVEVIRRLRGSESIQEIALSVGFSHAKELAREFRKVHGMTPMVYRKSEVRSQKSKVESRKSKVESRKSEVGSRLTDRVVRGCW